MPNALHMAADDVAMQAAVKRSRKLLNKRALVAAAASAVPVPGLDWAVDAAMLSKLTGPTGEATVSLLKVVVAFMFSNSGNADVSMVFRVN